MKDHELKIIRHCAVLLLLVTSWACGNQRTTTTLTENWHIKQLDTDKPDVAALTRSAASPDRTWLPARMPAQVHKILLQHGKISDPHIGKNAADSAWVGEKDWAYSCVFQSPAGDGGPVFQRFGGLDTLATVYLNGRKIGDFNNMFRQYRVDVREQLSPGGRDNILLIIFSSPLRFINQVDRPERHKGLPRHSLDGIPHSSRPLRFILEHPRSLPEPG